MNDLAPVEKVSKRAQIVKVWTAFMLETNDPAEPALVREHLVLARNNSLLYNIHLA